MAESQATHKLHDINDLAVYVMQSVAQDRSSSFLPQLRRFFALLRMTGGERFAGLKVGATGLLGRRWWCSLK